MFAPQNKRTPPRIGAAKVVVLLTDGHNNKGPDPKIEALKLKNTGAVIIVVGIGSSVSLSELQAIATGNLVFTPSDFDGLNGILRQMVSLIIKGMQAQHVFFSVYCYTTGSIDGARTARPTGAFQFILCIYCGVLLFCV